MPDSIRYRLFSLVGLVVLVLIAWALSENRRKVSLRIVGWGLGLQFLFAVLILRTPLQQYIFSGMQKAVDVLTGATIEGATIVFGKLSTDPSYDALMAFQVLPVIILVSAISAVLYHLRVIQALVHGIAWLMRRTLKTSGAETFCAALQIFFGIESMPALKAYLATMTRSELCTIMTTFMASIAGSVLIIYSKFGAQPGHLLAASLMSAPAAILVAKLMVPETEQPVTQSSVRVAVTVDSHNVIDAAARGTSEGLNLALNVGAMLIAFVGLVFLLNLMFESVVGVSFTTILSWVFTPFAWLLGVPSQDVRAVAALLAKKTVINEFLAYRDLQQLLNQSAISPRGATLATYALCGFANPGSLGILIAGLSSLVPERRSEICSLGLTSLIAGTIASFMTACIAGIVVYE